MMHYKYFKEIISEERMRRYINASDGNERKAMALYRYNLTLSSEMFKIISVFEVALRNKITLIMEPFLGEDWLRDSCLAGGIFDTPRTIGTKKVIGRAYDGLVNLNSYTPTKLLAEMEFGVWKYMYSAPEYMATGQKLLRVFPNKPQSTPTAQISNRQIFNELNSVNKLRNRIAHHEPICFSAHRQIKSISYAKCEYQRMMKLFSWMGIDSGELLRGIDYVEDSFQKILNL